MQTRYFAYHLDPRGVTHASYEIDASDDALAVSEARHFLKFHSSIEIWHGARWIARLVREEYAPGRDSRRARTGARSGTR